MKYGYRLVILFSSTVNSLQIAGGKTKNVFPVQNTAGLDDKLAKNLTKRFCAVVSQKIYTLKS